jgi:Zn-dependent peptidase ImmA (M78 family)
VCLPTKGCSGRLHTVAKQLVPITPEVLQWAVEESGMAPEELAAKCNVSVAEFEDWSSARGRPTLTQFRKLATALRRPSSVLLLPKPPAREGVQVQFRHPPGSEERSLHPAERTRLREATRLQRGLRWVLNELGEADVSLPRLRTDSDAAEGAAKVRALLKVPVSAQLEWKNEHHALREWRDALEHVGISVLLLPMGKECSRGFSVWDKTAPVIAINTHWNASARIFTVFHELGHLVTRTNSVCEESTYKHRPGSDPVERWCESFSASLLLPWAPLKGFLLKKTHWDGISQITDIGIPSKLARTFKVSVRAASLRLISQGVAGWTLYRSIPKASETKSGGGGKGGRTRPVIRLAEYGNRTARVLLRGMHEDVLSRDDVLSYLNVGDQDLDKVAEEVTAP